MVTDKLQRTTIYFLPEDKQIIRKLKARLKAEKNPQTTTAVVRMALRLMLAK